MANKYLQLLQGHQQDIVKDLDVTYILDELFTKGAINDEEFTNIFEISKRADRARYLIEILTRKIISGNSNSFEAFVNCLAKDYNWLWEKLNSEVDYPMLNDSFEDSLSKGDVPRLPKHYVSRVALEKDINSKLKLLTRHNVIVLHGMLGSGKTTLAISVLRRHPDLINENFSGVVFWLDMRDCKTEDDIIAQQNKLFRKISLITDAQNSMMNSTISMSSIGSNGDSHSISSCEWTWRDLRDKLKNQFTGQLVKDALLILDGVSEKKCAEAFDIGCKMLVTTRDVEVVGSLNAQIIKVENSFREHETLQVFASFLGVADVDQLPRQARKLHEICKGSPFHVSLIGSQLAESKERLIHDPSRWSYYINKFKRKEFFSFLPRYNDDPMKTIEICVNSLAPDILNLFKKLTIFPDNAKVTAKVLSKLWHKDQNEVTAITKNLFSKSLITKTFEPQKKDYTYEIHDLIMNYLRKCLDKDEIKRLHSEFLNSYGYGNIENVSMDIVDDGYIAFYIGHHILNTDNLNNKWILFSKLFLDLRFIGNKVRLTGPDDVLLDLQKYEKYIVGNGDNLDKELLINVKGYLSTYGTDLFRYPNTDIIQSLLQHENKGILYTKASQLAQESCSKNELVFEFLHEQQNVEEVKHYSTIDVKEIINVVCFLVNYVLVGTSSGFVKCFHLATNTLKLEVKISATPIKWLGPCPLNPPLVAALSYDGVVKIWYFEDLEDDASEKMDNGDVIDEEPEDTYDGPNQNRSLKLNGPFMNCRWMNYSQSLLVHTQNQIQIYSSSGEIQKVIDINDKEILCCVPCNHDRYVIIASITMNKDTNITCNVVEVINIMTKDKVAAFEETDTVMDLLTVRGTNRIITLKDKEIMEHEFKVSSYQNNCNIFRCKMVLNSSDIRDCLSFLSMAVNKSGSHLFVSTNDSRVICVDLKTNSRVFDLENRRGNIVSMSVSEVSNDDFTPGSDVLVTGTGSIENCAKVWYLDPSYVTHKHEKVRLTTKFDTSFLNIISPSTINTPNNGTQSNSATPKRHQSFGNHRKTMDDKQKIKTTKSLDRYALKPLNLRGICNGNLEGGFQPFLAVVDDKNNIQIMRGRNLLTQISSELNEHITIVRISPCNHYIFYGTTSGTVKKCTLRTKQITTILDVYSPVQYMEFVNTKLLVVSGKNRCMIGYRKITDDYWQPEMMQKGNTSLGSQEILNDLQGIKKMNGAPDKLSSSGSESSICRERMFPHDHKSALSKNSGLIASYWIEDIGLMTIESNASIKHWDQECKLVNVLNGRQMDAVISRATFKKNVMAICDDRKKGFQTFDVVMEENNKLQLCPIQDMQLLNCITSCDLTSDGNILALGLDNGDVVVWNVRNLRQLSLLKHHKSKVQWCTFSPVPDRLYRSTSMNSPNPSNLQMATLNENSDEQPPLVLVTMASEIVWWNITYLMKLRANRGLGKTGLNVISPVATPIEIRNELPPIENVTLRDNSNFFFGDDLFNPQHCWKAIWKNKTYKEGAKRKEILACIKLSGISAKRLCHDDKFSCFTTVDNAGQIHIMNVMRQHSS